MCLDECLAASSPVDDCILAARELAAQQSLTAGTEVPAVCTSLCQQNTEAMYGLCMGCEDEQSGIDVDWDAQLSPLWRIELASIGCAQAVSVTPPHILLLVLLAAFAVHFNI